MAIPFSSWDGGGGILVTCFTLSVRLSVRLHTETVQVCIMVHMKLLRLGREYMNHCTNLKEYESIEISGVEIRTIASQTTSKSNVTSTVCLCEQLYEYQNLRITAPL